NGEVKSLFNPGESYGDFLIPGLLVLILQQTLLMGIAESVAKEREENTIYGLYSASNKSVWSAVVGKGSFYLLLFSSYAFLFFTLHFSIFKISFRGSVIAVVIAAILFLVAAVYIAILASSFLKRKIVALQIFAFTTYPVFLMSGYPWPHQAMPWFIKYISFFFPSTPFLNVFSRLTQMGAGWNDVIPELTHLTILALSALVLARLRFGNLIKHSEAEISKEEKIGIDNLDLSEV
ncbi:MAG: ABC transporter permease, partial [Bacillota bacterium]